MKFQYQAKKKNGEATSGELDAASIAEARQQLRAQGLFVSKLAPQKLNGQSSSGGGLQLFGRITKSDLVMMLSQLTIMCQSGVDLAEALENVANQCSKPAFRTVLQQVHADVSNGASFSEALRRHPRAFDEMFVAGIASGEQAGTITQVLERLTYLIRGDLRLKSTVWSMLMYPMVLCGVTFLVLNALIFFVLPQFATVFESLEKPVPPLTQFLLNLGTFVRTHLVLVIGSFFSVVIAAALSRKTKIVCRAWDYSTLHLMFVRTATRALLTGRTFRMLGTMLMSGVPLVEGLRLCRSASGNALFQDLFRRVERDVLIGEGLGRTLLSAHFLPNGAAQMVITAERSGKMGEVIKNVGEYYEDEGERALRDLVKIAEPAVIVFLGVIVAGIVLSIVLPMLDVSTSSS
jgi:type II secretory pathway component PulF